MNVLIAVIEDLLTFALSPFSVSRSSSDEKTQFAHSAVSQTREEYVPEITSEEEEEAPLTFRSTADIMGTGSQVGTEKNTVMYAGGAETPLFVHPTKEFDGVMARIPYGAMLMLIANQGRWSQVVFEGRTGWVLREELMDRAAHVYPHFVIGSRNEADDPNTIRVRAMLDDEYAGGLAHLPLQSGEYVHYRLVRRGLRLPWGDDRPRMVGNWHNLLRGAEGVHVGVRPKTGCIFEYTNSDGHGHVAFVEAVFPDETINISEADHPEGGMYNERILTQEEWRELKPVFIQIT